MKIKQTRIRNINKLLSDLEENTKFLLGVTIDENISLIIKEKLKIPSLEYDKRIFPHPDLGIMNRRNSVGEEIVNKSKEKEPYEVALNWTLTDWGGNIHSGTNYITKSRYKRDFIEPKELKLLISEKKDEEKIIIVDKTFINNQSDFEEIKFAANLLLEIFKQVETFNIEEGNIVDSTPVESVNWEILPQGERIWEAFSREVNDKNISKSERILIKERFEFLENYYPDNIYKGTGGYSNYIVFEFRDINTYVIESIIYGNATYIFKNEWESVSKLTKKEILNGNLAEERIIHNNSWQSKIVNHLPKK